MNRAWLIGVVFLFGFTSNETVYDTSKKVTNGFRDVEATTQAKQWRVFTGTPTLNDLEDNECVKVSSNGYVAIQCRDNVEIFSIKMSCVTVVR